MKPLATALVAAAICGIAAHAWAQSTPKAPASAPTQSATPPAGPAQPTEIWHVDGFVDNKHKFSHCAAEVPYDNGAVLSIARTPAQELNVAFQVGASDAKPGDRWPVKLHVDTKLDRDANGVWVQPKLLVVAVGKDDKLYDALQKGSLLTLEAGNTKVAFSLKGAGKALADLRDCVQSQGKKGVNTEQGAGGAFTPLLREVFARAGILDALVPIPLDRLPPEKRPFDFAWRYGPLVGGLREGQAPDGGDVSELTATYMDNMKKQCPGPFTSSFGEIESLPRAALRTAEFTCELKDSKTAGAIIFFFAKSGMLSAFITQGKAVDESLAQRVRDDLGKALREVASATPPDAAASAPSAPAPATGQKPPADPAKKP